MSDPTTYRIVEDGPEFQKYRDLTENKHQPLPEGVTRWYADQHHVYATPDGFVIRDGRLQAIADAWNDLKNAKAHPVDDSHVDKMRECLDFRLDALTQEVTDDS